MSGSNNSSTPQEYQTRIDIQSECEECREDVASRQYIAADFIIRGYGTVDCDALVSFDTAYSEAYFTPLAIQPTN